jgi:parallel beta-helix repeat protein
MSDNSFPLGDRNIVNSDGIVTVFNVKSNIFGAKGDNVANDRPAIQAAITACIAAGGGMVFFPAGSYLLGDVTPLSIVASKVTLRGANSGAVSLVKTLAGNMVEIGNGVSSCNDTTIEHMGFDGGDGAGWAIYNNVALNTRILGVYLLGSYACRVTGNTFGSIKGTGLKLAGGSFGCFVAGNRIDGYAGPVSGSVGVHVGDCRGTAFSGNIIETFDIGVDFQAGAIDWSGGYFESTNVSMRNTGAVIYGVSVSGVLFSGPYAASACDIDLTNCIGFSIKGCDFVGPWTTSSPIRLGTSATGVVIQACHQASGTEIYSLVTTLSKRNLIHDYEGLLRCYQIQGATRVVVPHTGSVSLEANGRDSWTSHTNTGASGSIVVFLPAATVGQEYVFTVTAAQQFNIDVQNTENFRGKLAGKYMYSSTLGDWARFWCVIAGVWEYERSGTWNDEP